MKEGHRQEEVDDSGFYAGKIAAVPFPLLACVPNLSSLQVVRSHRRA